MSSFLDCHVTLMNQLETLGTGTWSTYDEAGALRDWAIIIPSAYPRSSPLPYAGIRSRRCWRLAAPTGSASGMGVTDLDLDPVSRMSESSGSYARVFCMLATASGSPKRTEQPRNTGHARSSIEGASDRSGGTCFSSWLKIRLTPCSRRLERALEETRFPALVTIALACKGSIPC